jgi:hypothetical protein
MAEAPAPDDLTARLREVDALWRRTEDVVAELMRRVSDGVSQVKSAASRVRALPSRLTEHRRALIGVGAGVVVAAGLGITFAVVRLRRARRPSAVWRRRARAYRAILADPERVLRPPVPIWRKVLGAVLATASTMLVRGAIKRWLLPYVERRPERLLPVESVIK